MEWNTVLFWNTIIFVGLLLARGLGTLARSWDWVVVSALVLGITGAGWWLFPAYAGLVGGVLTGVFIIAPLLLQKRILTLVQDGQWTAAARLAELFRLLHPAPSHRHDAAVLREHAARSDRTEPQARVRMSGRVTSRRAPVATYALVGLNLLMFAVELARGVDNSNDDYAYYHLGAVMTSVFHANDLWRLVAANFLHFGTAHLVFNMVALVAMGPMVERFCGIGRYLVIYLASGIGAMAGVVLAAKLGWLGREMLVGASGAIMGLVGAQGAILWRIHRLQGARVAAQQLRPVITMVVLQVIFDQLMPQVSGTAHLVGLGCGLVVTILLLVWRDRPGAAGG